MKWFHFSHRCVAYRRCGARIEWRCQEGYWDGVRWPSPDLIRAAWPS